MADKAFQRVRAGSGQGEAAARPRAAVHRAASGADRSPGARQPGIGNAALPRMLSRARDQHDAGGGPPDRAVLARQPGIGNAALARMLGRAQHAPAAVQRSAAHDVLRAPGQPLSAPVKEEMEARLGADLSDVRVHTDSAARASAAELGARAYTSGSHVVIGDGGADKHTLAHELTHAIQQRTGPVAGTDVGNGLKLSDPSDHDEKAAEVNAARAMRAPLSQHRPTAAAGFEREAAVAAAQAMSGSTPAFPLGRRSTGPQSAFVAQLRPARPSVQRLPVTITEADAPEYPRPVDLYADLRLEPEHELVDLATLDRWWMDDKRHEFPSVPVVAAMVRAARSQPERIPPMPGRSRFSVDPAFTESDIANRAITSLTLSVQTTPNLGALEARIHQIARYRLNPSAVNLSQALGDVMRGGVRIRLSFPSRTGEVMYVITENYELIIGARSGTQRDLPHPALIGGEEPTVLSAGMVEFADGRIKKIEINASGHFKPNAPSSVEVSAALFNRLPGWAFHPQFEGFSVFRSQHPPLGLLAGPSREEAAAPFDIVEGPEERGSIEATQAIPAQQNKNLLARLVNTQQGAKPWDQRLKEAREWLKNDLADLRDEPGLAAVFSDQMIADYRALLTELRTIADRGPRFRALRGNAVYDRLAGQLDMVLARLRH